jgi:chromosome segregation ATPase
MAFFKLLQGIGDKLGILESVPSPESAAPSTRIQTRTVSLRELASEIRSGDVRALADSLAELSVSFEKIFKAAGIQAKPEDWTIDTLRQVLASDACREKPRETIQKTVLELLASEGIPPEALIKDAMARDQAMDSFEARMRETMQNRKQSWATRIQEIERQIRELQAESVKMDASLKSDEAQWREWRKQKRAHERELASLASYIVDRPIITTDEDET